ncbi:MAG: hypothetical protein ABI649_02845 [Gaiellaceae bacterium]
MQAVGWSRSTAADAAASARLAFRTLLLVAIPGWFVMRAGGQWIYAKEGFGDLTKEPAWLEIGFFTGDLGGLLLLTTVILAGLGARRLARSEGGPSILARSATVLAILVLAAYLIAVWAMTAKPS